MWIPWRTKSSPRQNPPLHTRGFLAVRGIVVHSGGSWIEVVDTNWLVSFLFHSNGLKGQGHQGPASEIKFPVGEAGSNPCPTSRFCSLSHRMAAHAHLQQGEESE